MSSFSIWIRFGRLRTTNIVHCCLSALCHAGYKSMNWPRKELQRYAMSTMCTMNRWIEGKIMPCLRIEMHHFVWCLFSSERYMTIIVLQCGHNWICGFELRGPKLFKPVMKYKNRYWGTGGLGGTGGTGGTGGVEANPYSVLEKFKNLNPGKFWQIETTRGICCILQSHSIAAWK